MKITTYCVVEYLLNNTRFVTKSNDVSVFLIQPIVPIIKCRKEDCIMIVIHNNSGTTLRHIKIGKEFNEPYLKYGETKYFCIPLKLISDKKIIISYCVLIGNQCNKIYQIV